MLTPRRAKKKKNSRVRENHGYTKSYTGSSTCLLSAMKIAHKFIIMIYNFLSLIFVCLSSIKKIYHIKKLYPKNIKF